MEEPRTYVWPMDMNNGVGITWESGGVLDAGGEREKNWDNCNSIINKYNYKNKTQKSKLYLIWKKF